MAVVLGVDGGGTATHVAVADEQGMLLGAATGGVSNWEDVGFEAAGAALRAAILEATQRAGVSVGDVDATTIGLAGVDWPSDEQRWSALPAALELGGRWEIVNDAFVALRAGANHPWGVAVIAGGGSVVAGRAPNGREARTLGLGPAYGDFGGMADIADEAVRAIGEAYIGLRPPTTLADRFVEAFAVEDVGALLERLSRTTPRIEGYGPLVFAAAAAGDGAARSIVERAGAALGAAAGLIARRLEIDDRAFDVVLAGSVLRGNDRVLRAALDRELRRAAPNATPVRLEVPPVVGAVLRALESVGEKPGGPQHLRLSMETMKALAYDFE